MNSLEGAYRLILVTIVVLVLIFGLAASRAWSLWARSEEMADRIQKIARLAGELTFLSNEEQIVERTRQQWSAAMDLAVEMVQLAAPANDRAAVHELERLFAWSNEVFQLLSAAPTAEARAVYRLGLLTVTGNLDATVRGLHAEFALNQRRRAMGNIVRALIASNLTLIVLALGLSFHLRVRVLVPLHRMMGHVIAYGQGDRTARILPTGIREFDQFGSSLNRTMERVEALTKELEAEVAEKELIIRESHHRIKNNIAVIAGFLSLQAGQLEDPRVAAVLDEATGRVRAIADLYAHMLLEHEFEAIDAGAYLETLVDSVLALAEGETAIAVEKCLDPIKLSPRVMMPLGIIVNELLTNVVKYAFLGRPVGWVAVRLRSSGPQTVLQVEDDGRGIDSPSAGSGFGLTLVSILCHQIKAEWSIGPRVAGANGTLARVTL